MYIHCYTLNRMKTILKVYVVLAIAVFISKIYTGLDWSSWINGFVVSYAITIVAKLMGGDKNA